MNLVINPRGQIVGQLCAICGRPSEECAGRCTACDGDVRWNEAERGYVCPCGKAALFARRLAGEREGG